MGEPVEIDAVGLLCPLPVLRLRKVLATVEAGAQIKLRTSDPMAEIDVPHFCTEEGHSLTAQSTDTAGVTTFLIRQGG